jgi:putative methionine-R-sulfoxide reductase with GAF domain
MDLSALKLQDPAPALPRGERRRRVRHKLQTPVYASFNGPQTGMVLDLSELLDLHEDGFAVQAAERLEVNQALTFCLDLPETRAYIHGAGHVVWSDGAGRGGIRFSGLPDSARHPLKEWLFVNLLIGCANQAGRTEQLSRHLELGPVEPSPAVPAEPPAILEPSVPAPDLSGMLSAVDAVRREVLAAGDDLDAVLQLITERALSLTGASGAAVAFLTDGKMICRAHAGEPAPPLGAPVDVTQGVSGECVRSGRMVACEDTESDPRADREICRTLGIRSILAAPIVSDFRVVGLLEVFSSGPRAFTNIQETVLDRLVEFVPKTCSATRMQPDTAASQTLSSRSETKPPINLKREARWDTERVAQEPLNGVPIRRLHLGLLVLAVAFTALALGYVLAPTIEKNFLGRLEAKNQPAAPIVSTQNEANLTAKPKTPEDVRKLAEQGDAEAQWNMGVRYHNGEGVPQDDAQAVQWFLRAAEQGHLTAQASLGAYYWRGRGVPQDLSKAYFWSVLALAQGDEAMKSRLEGLAAQMTRAQVAAARQQAEDWLHQHARRAKPEGN